MKMKKQQNGKLVKSVVEAILIKVLTDAVSDGVNIFTSLSSSVIVVSEWDSCYNIINKILHDADPATYDKYRVPTTNKEIFELTNDVTYFIRLDKKNYVKVTTYTSGRERSVISERKMSLKFIGDKKYIYRWKFLQKSLKLTDDDHIRVKYLNDSNISFDVLPHMFDNMILDDAVKNRLIKKLSAWRDSKEWYIEHQLVYKIGVLLYGKPGTGKSTVARAVSAMFGNAPILIVDQGNIMASVSNIIRMRKRTSGTLIVLIEDFDMFFKNRNEDEDEEEELNDDFETTNNSNSSVGAKRSKNRKKTPQTNQNSIFQLLDGAYSTDDTIYIATTNYRNKLDPALIRYGRFDIQEELGYFNEDKAVQFVEMFGYDRSILSSMPIEYPVQPAYLQSMIMEYRANI